MGDARHMHARSLIRDVGKFIASNSFTDLTIIGFNGTRYEKVNVHKLVVASISKTLNSYLMSLDENIDPVVIVPDMDYEDIFQIVNLIYNGNLTIKDENQLNSLTKNLDSLGISVFQNQPLECFLNPVAFDVDFLPESKESDCFDSTTPHSSPSTMSTSPRPKETKTYQSCTYCNNLIPTKEYSQHVRTIHRRVSTVHKCEFCGKICKKDSELQIHRRIHTGEKPYQCQICFKSFRFKHILIRHLRYHTGERPYRCENCDMGFAQKSDLDKHFRIHTGELPYECQHCDQRFRRNDYLKKHEQSHFQHKWPMSLPELSDESLESLSTLTNSNPTNSNSNPNSNTSTSPNSSFIQLWLHSD